MANPLDFLLLGGSQIVPPKPKILPVDPSALTPQVPVVVPPPQKVLEPVPVPVTPRLVTAQDMMQAPVAQQQAPVPEPELPEPVDFDTEFDAGNGMMAKIGRDGKVVIKAPSGLYREVTNPEVRASIMNHPAVAKIKAPVEVTQTEYAPDQEFDAEGSRWKYDQNGDVYEVHPAFGAALTNREDLPEPVRKVAKDYLKKSYTTKATDLTKYLTAQPKDFYSPEYVTSHPDFQNIYKEELGKVQQEWGQQATPPTQEDNYEAVMQRLKSEREAFKLDGKDAGVKLRDKQIRELEMNGSYGVPVPGTNQYILKTPSKGAAVNSTAAVKLAQAQAGFTDEAAQQQASQRTQQRIRQMALNGGISRLELQTPARQVVNNIPAYVNWYTDAVDEMSPEDRQAFNPMPMITDLQEASKSGDTGRASAALTQLNKIMNQTIMKDRKDALPDMQIRTAARNPDVVAGPGGEFLGVPITTKPPVVPVAPAGSTSQIVTKPTGSGREPSYDTLRFPVQGQLMSPTVAESATTEATNLRASLPKVAEATLRNIGIADSAGDNWLQHTLPVRGYDGQVMNMNVPDAFTEYTRAAITKDPKFREALDKNMRRAMEMARIQVTDPATGKAMIISPFVSLDELAGVKPEDMQKKAAEIASARIDGEMKGWRKAAESGEGWLPTGLLNAGSDALTSLASLIRTYAGANFYLKNQGVLAKDWFTTRTESGKPLDPSSRGVQMSNAFHKTMPLYALQKLIGY